MTLRRHEKARRGLREVGQAASSVETGKKRRVFSVTGSEVSPENDTPQHAHAHNKPSAVEKGHSPGCNSTQHAKKLERERLPTAQLGLVPNSAH
jgi:hypothetical protein